MSQRRNRIEMNESENTTYQHFWNTVKLMQRRKSTGGGAKMVEE